MDTANKLNCFSGLGISSREAIGVMLVVNHCFVVVEVVVVVVAGVLVIIGIKIVVVSSSDSSGNII